MPRTRFTAVRRVTFPLLSLVASLMMVAWTAQLARAEDPNGVEKAKSLSRAFRNAAKEVIPTVVKIKTVTKAKTVEGGPRGRTMRDNPFKGTPFEDFFNDEMPGFRMPRGMPQRQGVGSGVIIDPKGIVLTNDHVVADADEVLVELADGRQFTASDIKVDPDSDLAVLRIKADEALPAAKLGDSDALEIGDWVLAIGNPFDLDLTVSAGIISSKGRVLPSNKRANFLQTDAAINPGNSGGPLVNLDGEVVGINTAIASSSGGYQGVGFAIPINMARWVTDQLVKTGSVQRAYIGVAIGEINGKLAQKLGVDRLKGVLVAEVFKDSPAAAAGMKEGDVITAFAGQPTPNPRRLQEVVERLPTDSKQKVEIIRDGKKQEVTVTVKKLPADLGTARRGSPKGEEGSAAAEGLGFEVADLTEDIANRLGYKGFQGVVISNVDENGIAAEAGLREGMMILRVGKTAIKSVAEFKAALKKETVENGVMFLVRTQEGNRFVVLQKQ